MNKLNNLLEGTGVKPHKKEYTIDNIANGREAFDKMFNNPMEQLNDLLKPKKKL